MNYKIQLLILTEISYILYISYANKNLKISYHLPEYISNLIAYLNILYLKISYILYTISYLERGGI